MRLQHSFCWFEVRGLQLRLQPQAFASTCQKSIMICKSQAQPVNIECEGGQGSSQKEALTSSDRGLEELFA